MEQLPGESDIAFFKRIQQMAGDPVAFENMALGKDGSGKIDATTGGRKGSATDEEGGSQKKQKGGYQRAEEWDAEDKARREKGEYTWEEKVKFEGQKYGNHVNQNEILRKNLKGF